LNTFREVLPLVWPGFVAGLAIALMCAALSPLVVLKRMAFVGQGISHAAFGGIGIAAMLAWLVPGLGRPGGTSQFLIVLAFCLASAILIAGLTRRGSTQADTAIGIVLVGSMSLGAILINLAPATGGVGWESILFGSLFEVNWPEARIAWAVAVAILLALWGARRAMMFWAFDEPAAPAFGVSGGAMKYLLIVLLTLAIVTAMKLAGVVLATALLVLPGAAALKVSDRIGAVMIASAVAALAGIMLGLALSLTGWGAHLPPGACIVAVLVLLFAAASVLGGLRSKIA
jgi:zinc transport system permease protein